MDIWVVAAAAAAGYLRKYCQNLSNLDKTASPRFTFGKLPQREKQGSHDYTDITTHSDYHLESVDGTKEFQVASTSAFVCGSFDESRVLSLATLPTGFSTDEIANEAVHSGNVGENHGKSSYNEIDYFHGFQRKKTSLRTKHTNVKPLSSLESCLMAQLYNERVRLEDYVSSLQSPSTPTTTTRPLLVTDGKRIISRANPDSFGRQMVPKVSVLPKFGLLELPKKSKLNFGRGEGVRLSSSIKLFNGKQFQSRDGSKNEAIPFCIGITIGLISSFIANKREVDKLKESLKQTENLVQDLQEELEMKNSLTVNELVSENYKTQDTFTSLLSTEKNMEVSTRKKAESPDSMSKIEAELEAELERLGLNMQASTLDNRLTELEIDHCFAEDFAQGELRTDMFNEEAAVLHKSNQNSSSTSTTHYGNYAVSPRELSLKLLEVINLRLEDRVKELETALQNSEIKVNLIESDCKKQRPSVEPLVMNLSGDALDAYTEAYEEMLKVNDSDEEYSPAHPFSRTLSYGHSDGANDKTTPEEIFSSQLRLEDENSTRVQELLYSTRVQELLDFGVSEEDESSGCEDEMEKELIKQIVERTKKGSPAMLNAQKVLFLMDGK
ncbi:hypothetical protein ACFE04_004941 [Oxalis oulophora]